jgi:poly-gamma-glutamate synthesis protein (capsule biosynthesis protein)
MNHTPVTLGFVGDLLVDREHPLEPFTPVRALLDAPDILFGNLEASFTDDPHPAPSGGTPLFPGAHNLGVFGDVGFDVLSLANNHSVDAGHAALLDNLQRLRAQGVATCGAGATLNEARRPAILAAGGLRVAYLAYASVFPMGYEARSNVPGIVPLRSYDLWRTAFDNYHLPGTPPRANCVLDDGDVDGLKRDIAAAREQADLVITSFHWGDFLRPYHLTEHEKRVARLSIDAGADMVVGHHHHTLRGMEWYRGKPIVYGLGHFVFDLRLALSDEARSMFSAMPPETLGYQTAPREGWPWLPLHPDMRLTAFAWARVEQGRVTALGAIPCRLRPSGAVEAVDPDSDDGLEVLAFLERCQTTQKLAARWVTDSAPVLAGCRGVQLRPTD